MKLIQLRSNFNYIIFCAAITLSLLPIYGLLTGVAISIDRFGGNLSKYTLINEPDMYWFLIKVQILVVSSVIIYSFVKFPFIENCYSKICEYRLQHKIKFFLLFFIGIPIFITLIILFILHAVN